MRSNLPELGGPRGLVIASLTALSAVSDTHHDATERAVSKSAAEIYTDEVQLTEL